VVYSHISLKNITATIQLTPNEDYEFNTRVRESGGTVWLDPAIRSVYFSRSTLKKLAIQYGRYGFWKFKMLQRYPHTLRWRQALPPVFVLSLFILIVLSLFVGLTRYILAAQVLFYFIALGSAGLKLAIEKGKGSILIGLPLAIMSMHIFWGAGFLWSGISDLFVKHD